MYENGLRSLAMFTARSIEILHKLGELLSVYDGPYDGVNLCIAVQR